MTMAAGSRKPEVDVGVAKNGAAGGGPLALVGKLALTNDVGLAAAAVAVDTVAELFTDPLMWSL